MPLHLRLLFPHTELKKAKVDLQAMKKQAESTNTEYDRLAADNQKLQVTNLLSQCFRRFPVSLLDSVTVSMHCVVRVCVCRTS